MQFKKRNNLIWRCKNEILRNGVLLLVSSYQRMPIVLDCGTGYTKMGYAGNNDPQYIIPTVLSKQPLTSQLTKRPLNDLDMYIGDEAFSQKTYQISYPMKHGMVDQWDDMELFWQYSLMNVLHCDPEQHHVLLTEPPLNPPENREYTAEIFFESFNVPGLYIAVQAVLALAASWIQNKEKNYSLTGTVIDSGDGVTHVIPVAEGYVIGSAIKHVPIAGRDITQFIQQCLRDRNEPIPPEDSLLVSQRIKELYSYTCPDVVKEFKKFEQEPDKYIKQHVDQHSITKKEYTVDVGYERFMGPEVFFSPEICNPDFTTSLPDSVDHSIQSCPIDTRRGLYKNIVLSGGSTMYKDFGRRLQRDIKRSVDERLAYAEQGKLLFI